MRAVRSFYHVRLTKQEEKRRHHLEMERKLAEEQAQLAMLASKDKEAKHKDYLNMKKV